MIKDISKIQAFLSKHSLPVVVINTSMKDGYVACIGPIPTICGPELHVNRNTHQELTELLKD